MSNEKAPEETLEVVAPEAVEKGTPVEDENGDTLIPSEENGLLPAEADKEPEPEPLPTYESPDGDLHSPIIGKWSKGTRRQQRAEARNNEAGK